MLFWSFSRNFVNDKTYIRTHRLNFEFLTKLWLFFQLCRNEVKFLTFVLKKILFRSPDLRKFTPIKNVRKKSKLQNGTHCFFLHFLRVEILKFLIRDNQTSKLWKNEQREWNLGPNCLSRLWGDCKDFVCVFEWIENIGEFSSEISSKSAEMMEKAKINGSQKFLSSCPILMNWNL